MNFSHCNKYLLSKPLLLMLGLISLVWFQLTPPRVTAQIVEETLDKDDLEIDENLPWGIKKWPYSTVVEVQDLAKSAYGRIVIDRYGIDESISPIKQPFSRIKPGKLVFCFYMG